MAAAYLAVSQANTALVTPDAGAPRVNPAAAERLGAQVQVIHSDHLGVPVKVDARTRRCVAGGCIVVQRTVVTPTRIEMTWAPLPPGVRGTTAYEMVFVIATSPTTRDAAADAVSLTTARAGVRVPLASALR